MSDLELRIVVDEEGPARAGDRVRGRVEARAHKEVRCDPLALRFGWRTSGKGSADGGGQSFVLFAGPLPPGEHSFPFDVHAPPGGPFTYRGELLSVAWTLSAQAHVPFAFDPKAEREVIVLAPERREGEVPFVPPAHYGPPSPLRIDLGSAGPMGFGCLAFVFVTPFFLFGLAWLAFGIYAMWHSKRVDPYLVGPGAALTFLTGAVLVRQAGRMLGHQRLGGVRLALASPVVERGRSIRATVQLQPRGALELNGITLKLRCKERTTRPSGDSNYTEERVVHEEEVKMLAPRRLEKGMPFRGDIDIPVLPGAYVSFQSASNSVSWEVLAHVDVEGWPDGDATVPVRVIP